MKIQKGGITTVVVVMAVGLFGWMFLWQPWKSVRPANQARISVSDDQLTELDMEKRPSLGRPTDERQDRDYMGKDVEECSRVQVLCVEGLERFDDETGCGCQPTGSIPTDWKLYSSDTVGFSMYYDPSFILREDTKTDVRFYRQGPSQRGQTEMYDGMIVTVRKVDVVGDTQAYIDDQVEQYRDIGSITEPLHDSRLNGIPTKEFGASGLGDARVIFVPDDDQTLLEVSYMAPDPTNAGFQKTIDLMLSTFRLIGHRMESGVR